MVLSKTAQKPIKMQHSVVLKLYACINPCFSLELSIHQHSLYRFIINFRGQNTDPAIITGVLGKLNRMATVDIHEHEYSLDFLGILDELKEVSWDPMKEDPMTFWKIIYRANNSVHHMR